MNVLLVDSYDSFTFNLVQAARTLGHDVEVVHSDAVNVDEVLTARAEAVVLGPGPGEPEHAGVLVSLAKALPTAGVPTLGVCLGHQALGLAFGARLARHPVCHGHSTPIQHDGTGLFAHLPPRVPMGRYHSLVLHDVVPPLRVTARADGAVMAIEHVSQPAWGVQFHPESVLSEPAGVRLLARFFALAAARYGP